MVSLIFLVMRDKLHQLKPKKSKKLLVKHEEVESYKKESTLSKDLVSTVLRKELSIIGTWNSTYRPQKPDDWKKSLELIQNGVRPSELVTHWISLDELPDTLKRLYDHKRREKAFNSVKVMVSNWA